MYHLLAVDLKTLFSEQVMLQMSHWSLFSLFFIKETKERNE